MCKREGFEELAGMKRRRREKRGSEREREREKKTKIIFPRFLFLFSWSSEREQFVALILRCFQKKEQGDSYLHTHTHAPPEMADWLSDDALLAALASEPAPLHHLTGKD